LLEDWKCFASGNLNRKEEKKEMKRKAFASLVVALVLGIAAPSFAAGETRNITADYSGISLYVDSDPPRSLT
jgi:hypothetical protein